MDKLPFECKRVGGNDRQPPVTRNFWTLQSHIKSKKSLFLRRKVSMEFEVKLNKKHRIHDKKLTRFNSAGKNVILEEFLFFLSNKFCQKPHTILDRK